MQFGSEAKGQIAGMIADQWRPSVAVGANHPNAGHTYNDYAGNKFIHRMLPVGAAAPSVNYILIGPGAVIDVEVLRQELLELSQKVDTRHKTLVIHPRAALVTEEHREAEKSLVKIGSTMKGSMEAIVQKMRRNGDYNNTAAANLSQLHSFAVSSTVSAAFYDAAISDGNRILVEGAQGFSLGIHERFYPYGTSRDVSTYQVLADCRIPFGSNVYVQGVMRTYPIRVANRYNEEGQMIGSSGPYYPDQQELDWTGHLNRSPELTTVTKLPRRIFSFSAMQIQDAARVMGVDGLSITFCDYLQPGEVEDFTFAAYNNSHKTPVVSRSYGPEYHQVMRVDGSFVDFKHIIETWFGRNKS
jgi:adenylosuccinate synthase